MTERISAPAADGTLIPVTVAYRRGLRRDGSAPGLLYGYGAYEACSWPEFSVITPSLLDRGFVYAVAHVRGGGEGGRRWWTEGRLDRKRTTFTDFIAAADMLAGAADGRAARTGSSRAACRPAGCCRARCSPWPRAGGGRWSPRSRSWTW